MRRYLIYIYNKACPILGITIELSGFIHHHSLCYIESFFRQFLLRNYEFQKFAGNTFQLFGELVIVHIAKFSNLQCKSFLYQHEYISYSLQGH
ncbi:hypothetical protein BT93_H1994 [Corymbia citriodora subsp. variegata]|nr:hypothetical protein BT93_H1994 [Corymbia citriodora subsp. variegata]